MQSVPSILAQWVWSNSLPIPEQGLNNGDILIMEIKPDQYIMGLYQGHEIRSSDNEIRRYLPQQEIADTQMFITLYQTAVSWENSQPSIELLHDDNPLDILDGGYTGLAYRLYNGEMSEETKIESLSLAIIALFIATKCGE